MGKCIILSRVSTDRQTVEQQTNVLIQKAKKMVIKTMILSSLRTKNQRLRNLKMKELDYRNLKMQLKQTKT